MTNININKTFKNGEYIKNEVRGYNRTMFCVGVNNGFSVETKRVICDTIKDFINSGKRKEVLDVIKTATDIKHLLGLIESVFMSKHIKVRKTRVKVQKIKDGDGKKTDVPVDKFYIIY